MIPVQIDSRFVFLLLSGATAIIVAFSVVGQYSSFFLGRDYLLGFVPLFDVRGEGNVPAVFSSMMLACAAFILYVLGRHPASIGNGDYLRWYVLGAAFLFLSVDEAFMLHEKLNVPLRELTGLTGFFHFTWVLPYFLAAMALGVLILPAVLRTPPPIRNLFILSGILYIGGAVGIEMIGAYYYVATDIDQLGANFSYILITTVEETLEMTGVVVFISTLLRLLEHQTPPAVFEISFRRKVPAD